mgnify:CR=1 FL=1
MTSIVLNLITLPEKSGNWLKTNNLGKNKFWVHSDMNNFIQTVLKLEYISLKIIFYTQNPGSMEKK